MTEVHILDSQFGEPTQMLQDGPESSASLLRCSVVIIVMIVPLAVYTCQVQHLQPMVKRGVDCERSQMAKHTTLMSVGWLGKRERPQDGIKVLTSTYSFGESQKVMSSTLETSFNKQVLGTAHTMWAYHPPPFN